MTRTRRSAKTAGTGFERQLADYLAQTLEDDRIDRRAKNGAKDRGDITGMRAHSGQRIVIEAKNTTCAQWLCKALWMGVIPRARVNQPLTGLVAPTRARPNQPTHPRRSPT